MSRPMSTAEKKRQQTRRALARKAAARKKIITKDTAAGSAQGSAPLSGRRTVESAAPSSTTTSTAAWAEQDGSTAVATAPRADAEIGRQARRADDGAADVGAAADRGRRSGRRGRGAGTGQDNGGDRRRAPAPSPLPGDGNRPPVLDLEDLGRTAGREGERGDRLAPGEPARAPRRARRLLGRFSNDDAIGGVAPFVPPRRRVGRTLARKRLRRQGFVALSPGRPHVIHRILPRTVIGICFVLLAFAVGAAFSGAAFYAYYDDRLAENEETVARFVEGFDQQFTDAAGAIDELRVGAVDDIRAELSPLGDYVDDANGVVQLPVTAGPSVWLIETRDDAGRIVSGTGFAVAPHEGGTAMVTSYSLVKSSTSSPAPPIDVVKGDRRVVAQLWTWDIENDLALIVVPEAIPPLELANERRQVESVGSRLFAMSGLGGQGSTASPGVLIDRSEQGLQHTAPVGALFDGGPLLTGDGVVVGVAALGYRPNGIDPGAIGQAPGIGQLCVSILSCAERLDEFEIEIDGDAEAPPATGEALRPDLVSPPAGDDGSVEGEPTADGNNDEAGDEDGDEG